MDAFEQSVSRNRDLLQRLAKSMTDYLTVAEVYLMQHRLIEIFGGLHGVRGKGAVEAAVFRPQTGYYNSIEEEAAGFSVERDTRHDIPNPHPNLFK
jgi:hypothetical protein